MSMIAAAWGGPFATKNPDDFAIDSSASTRMTVSLHMLQVLRIDAFQVEPMPTVLRECVGGGEQLEAVEERKLASQCDDPRITFLDRFAPI